MSNLSEIAHEVPGIKHTTPRIRDFLISLIKLHPHSSYVDPFAGSLTFALNSAAPTKFLGVLGVPESHESVHVEGNDVWRMAEDWRNTLINAKKYTPDTTKAMLFLDPPRPRAADDSGPYGIPFTQDDWFDLTEAAVDWPGPLIVATYFNDLEDTPLGRRFESTQPDWSGASIAMTRYEGDNDDFLAFVWRGAK